MELNLETWNGLEVICQKTKQFISYDDSKREIKIVKCNVFQRFYSRAFSFSSLRKTSSTTLLKFLILRTEPN